MSYHEVEINNKIKIRCREIIDNAVELYHMNLITLEEFIDKCHQYEEGYKLALEKEKKLIDSTPAYSEERYTLLKLIA